MVNTLENNNSSIAGGAWNRGPTRYWEGALFRWCPSNYVLYYKMDKKLKTKYPYDGQKKIDKKKNLWYAGVNSQL